MDAWSLSRHRLVFLLRAHGSTGKASPLLSIRILLHANRSDLLARTPLTSFYMHMIGRDKGTPGSSATVGGLEPPPSPRGKTGSGLEPPPSSRGKKWLVFSELFTTISRRLGQVACATLGSYPCRFDPDSATSPLG
jgi:hypothetical protein